MTARIRTPAQMELARTFADAFAAASHPGRWYSEHRGPLGWSPQLIPKGLASDSFGISEVPSSPAL